mmetsp:Transcript_61323/g.146025  ORF Transcript_61323/g.146025 Transcript_61323/m.146025 type:complete len:818 (-) Transcript_61323:206-2659(-)
MWTLRKSEESKVHSNALFVQRSGSMSRVVTLLSGAVACGIAMRAIGGQCFGLAPLGLPPSPLAGSLRHDSSLQPLGQTTQGTDTTTAAVVSVALMSGVAAAALAGSNSRSCRKSAAKQQRHTTANKTVACHHMPGDFDSIHHLGDVAAYLQHWAEAHQLGSQLPELPSLPALEFSEPAFAADAVDAAAAPDKPEIVLEEGVQYLYGPNGQVLVDPMNNQPLKDDWWNGFIGLQADAIKELDAQLRKAGVEQAFGWTIVLYTALVKVLFYPLQAGQLRSTSMMQLLQPKVKEIQEKFKDNPEEQTRLLTNLYSVMDVNPLAGCIPLFIQLPFFWSLYGVWRRLYVEDFTYYGESWLWVPSLAQPNPDFNLSFDWLFQFENGAPIMGWEPFGQYLIFPALLVGSTLWQSQQAQAQRPDTPEEEKNPALEILPWISVVLIGTISLELPQAVAVYYFTNSALTSAQTAWVKYTLREEIPGYAEFEKTGKFPEGALQEMANRNAEPAKTVHEAALRDAISLKAFLSKEENKNVDINEMDDKQIAPLGYAVARGDPEAVRFLIDRGADLKVRDGMGNTMLHYASGYGHLSLLQELLGEDEDEWMFDDKKWYEVTNKKGQTVLDAARVNRKGKVLDWITEHLGIDPVKLDDGKSSNVVDVEVQEAQPKEKTKEQKELEQARAALLAAAEKSSNGAEASASSAPTRGPALPQDQTAMLQDYLGKMKQNPEAVKKAQEMMANLPSGVLKTMMGGNVSDEALEKIQGRMKSMSAEELLQQTEGVLDQMGGKKKDSDAAAKGTEGPKGFGKAAAPAASKDLAPARAVD